jgi:hypothetical protein
VNVATIASPVSSAVFQLSFGASFLNPGANVVFDDLRASGDVFGPAEAFHLGILYGYIANLLTARDAIIHDSDAALALATIAAFQTALLATTLGIELDASQGDFLAFTLIALGLRHLKSAGREAAKAGKALEKGQDVGALERIVRAVALIQLATLALRGIGARKIEELLFYADEKFNKDQLALTAAAATP